MFSVLSRCQLVCPHHSAVFANSNMFNQSISAAWKVPLAKAERVSFPSLAR